MTYNHHQVDIERRGNTYFLDYYKEGEPQGYPNDANPREYEGSLRDYPLDRYPGYRGDNLPPDPVELEKYCFADEVEATTGKRWGGKQGIGELKEVGINMPTDHEEHELWDKAHEFFLLRHGLPEAEILKEQMRAYIDLLEGEGIEVHQFEMNEWGAYGPMRKLYMAEDIFVAREGAILQRAGHAPYKRGLEVGFQRFLTAMDCPIIHQIHGYGIQEPGPWVPIGENKIVGHVSQAGNQDGVDQILPVMARQGYEEVHIASLPSIQDTFDSSGEFHLDMVLGVPDIGLAVVYAKCLDYETRCYLRERDIDIIEVPEDEHHDWVPANFVVLAPGKIVMAAGAEETRRKLEREGVEVIPFDTSEIMKGGTNGIRCVTCQLVREEGPYIDTPDAVSAF